MPYDTMRCGRSHTTTCTCQFDVDVPWGKKLVPNLTLVLEDTLNLEQPTIQRGCSYDQPRR